MPTTAAPPVTVRVLLFASFADTLGFDSVELRFEGPVTVSDVLDRLRALPGGHRLPPRPLCALNLTHVQSNATVSGGDELAVLPPLAGG